MFSTNFHTFVLVTTLLYYIILRKMKKKDTQIDTKQYLFYVLYFPLTLYACYYFFSSTIPQNQPQTINIQLPQRLKSVASSDNLLSRPYPDSLSA